MSPLTATLIATTGVSLVSLAGIALTPKLLNSGAMEIRLVSFAAGVLITTSLIELLPSAIRIHGSGEVLRATLVGILAFYFLERLLRLARSKKSAPSNHSGHITNAPIFILIGDGIHNFIDGVLIAATFMVSPAAGWTVATAIALHELPHEIGDYAVLIRGGFSRRRALLANLLSGLLAVLGGLLTFSRPLSQYQLSWLVAASAGMFLYIALANLIPDAQHSKHQGRGLQAIPFGLGCALILVVNQTIQVGY